MNEQWTTPHVPVASNPHHGKLPGTPSVAGDRVCRRADPEHVQHQEFAVSIPPVRKETLLWCPAMREGDLAALHHPGKVDTVVNLRREVNDLLVALKARSDSQNTGQQPCRVNGRDFTVPDPRAGCAIHEMVEPAVLLGSLGGEKAQGREHSLASHLAANPTVICGDAKGRQAEAGGGDARHSLVAQRVHDGFAVRKGTIKHQAGARIGLLQKIAECAARNIVQKVFVNLAESLRCRVRRFTVCPAHKRSRTKTVEHRAAAYQPVDPQEHRPPPGPAGTASISLSIWMNGSPVWFPSVKELCFGSSSLTRKRFYSSVLLILSGAIRTSLASSTGFVLGVMAFLGEKNLISTAPKEIGWCRIICAGRQKWKSRPRRSQSEKDIWCETGNPGHCCRCRAPHSCHDSAGQYHFNDRPCELEVLWNGQTVRMFACDHAARATAITAKKPKATAASGGNTNPTPPKSEGNAATARDAPVKVRRFTASGREL